MVHQKTNTCLLQEKNHLLKSIEDTVSFMPIRVQISIYRTLSKNELKYGPKKINHLFLGDLFF